MSVSLAQSTHDAIAAMVWRCWRTLGAPAYAERLEHTLIDPEALIVLTAWITRAGESRMALAAADWCRQNHGILSHIRLRNLVNTSDSALALQVARIVGLANGTAPEAATHVKFTSKPTVDAEPAVRIHMEDASMLRMRLRALVGPAAKAEALTYLLSVGGIAGVTSSELARATLFGQRNLLDALNDLTCGGWVDRWRTGRRELRFSATDQSRHAFVAVPDWTNWVDRLRVAVVLTRCAEALEVGTVGAVAQMMAEVDAQAECFRLVGIGMPDWRGADDTGGVDRLRAWVAEAVSITVQAA